MSIHDLPPEIMAKIFHISTSFRPFGDRRTAAAEDCVSPATLSSVCTTWRYIAVNLPWLWSHIDFATQWIAVTEGQSNHLGLMTERSHGELVELSICVQRSLAIQHSSPHIAVELATNEALTRLSNLLAPLAPRIRLLDIYSDIYSGPELQAIVACMTKICVNGPLDMLLIRAKYNPAASTQLIPWSHLSHTIDPPPTDQITNRFLEPIQVLHLVNISISLSSSAYRGLTDLSITFTDSVHLMSCSRMVQILSSCPKLHRLCLDNLYAAGWVNAHAEPQTVLLRHLRYLRLGCARSRRLAPLLQLLRPKDQLLNFTIEVDNEPEFVEQLQTFFNENSKVTVLYVSTKNKNSWFAPLCKGLNQSLARLTLEDCDFADPDLAQFVNVEFRIRGYSLWTHLVKLELIRCVVDIALLEGMTANISMQELALVECEVRSPNSGVCSQLSLSMFTPQYVDRLRTTIKNHGDV